jgi:hypothetical protein
MIPRAVHRSPGIYFTTEEDPENLSQWTSYREKNISLTLDMKPILSPSPVTHRGLKSVNRLFASRPLALKWR